MSKVIAAIERLGSDIVKCNRVCQGVKRDQDQGYYPRAFFLDPDDSSEVEVAVVGRNPGFSTALEREFYRSLARQYENKRATYTDCAIVWQAIAHDHQYFLRPRHFLKELGLATDTTGFLWAEAVFCESAPRVVEGGSPSVRIPKATFEECSKFLQRMLFDDGLVPKGRPVLCLGNEALQDVRGLVGDQNLWKVIQIHHPTGSRTFANYFTKKAKRRLIDRPIKRHLMEDFQMRVGEDQRYICKFEPSGIKRLDKM